MSSEILGARTTSAFPLSIGTSLAFESLSQSGGAPYDPERKIPQHIKLGDYQQFWINLSTLFRNIYGAVSSQDAAGLLADDCTEVLLQEIESMEDIVRQETQSKLTVSFYTSNYKGLTGLASKASLRLPNTTKQIAYFKLHDKVIQNVLNIRHSRSEDVYVFDNKIKPKERSDALILTHVAYDLLCWPKFNKLDLIESHTGILKPRNLWYTKMYQSEDLACIPFIEIMLKFFGDNHTFRPFPIAARKTVLDLAIKKHWLWATTEAKVIQDLGTLNDHYLGDVVKNL